MFKKLFYFSCILLILGITSSSMAELVAYYGMDEGSGNVVADGSGNGHDGQAENGNLNWVEGQDGTALKFTGAGTSFVNCGTFNPSEGTGELSISLWINYVGDNGAWQGIIGKRDAYAAGQLMWCLEINPGSTQLQFALQATGWPRIYANHVAPIGTWENVTVTYDGTNATMYVDGTQIGTIGLTFDGGEDTAIRIGCDESNGGNPFNGSIDEVYIFNKALSVDEINQVINGELKPTAPGTAKKPNPSNLAEDVSIDVGKISWVPGDYVATDGGTHNVFFGTDPNVENATIEEPMGATVYADLDVNSIDLARLMYDTTYYWRVDEVNAPANPGTFKGKTWQFTTEPEGIALATDTIVDVTAYTPIIVSDEQEPNMTCNGSGLDVNDMHSAEINTMWLGYSEDPEDPVWIKYEFDKVYKFFELLVWNYNESFPSQDYGAKDVNIAYSIDGENWKTLDSLVQFNVAPGEDGYAANTVVDMNNAIAKYIKMTFVTSWTDDVYTGGLSEVRFFVIPTRATVPDPEDESEDIGIDQILGWKSGRGAASHKVYVGFDANSVRDGISEIIEEAQGPSIEIPLDLAKTYYWKVDEVNEAEDYTTWDGPVWSFSTVESLMIEGFEEGYDASDANAVWMTWTDGYNIDENGAEIGKGLDTPGLSEDSHSGDYAAPVYYENSGLAEYSEISANPLDLPIGTNDWSKGSPEALVIWFSGDPNNTTTQMYVKLNNVKVLYEDDPIYLTKSAWRPWVINLSDVSVNLSNITSISIGFEKLGSQDEVGTVLLDDISLSGNPPQIAAPVEPSSDGLIASYLMENNVNDSSGNGLNGTHLGTAIYVNGIDGYGKALEFKGGDSNDVVDLGLSEPNEGFNPEGSFSVSLWAKISNWSSGWGNVMVGNRGESGVGWQIRRGADSHLCFTTRGISNDDTYSDVASPPLNEWVHITCVYDSESFTKSIYINGILDRTVNLTGTNKTIAATTHNTYIGARANSDNSGFESIFTGQLDQIYIYGRALSAGEAAYLSDPTP